ncbi:MAG: SH3 domain-containing protein [Rhodobacteraceae bacterium]|nr:SH3 domain-containing protein [Paracoccaceae bacterium]
MKSLLFIIALLLSPFAAQAQRLILPDVFAVTGVASNDTLNVRQAPSGSSTDIGDLYPNELIEVISLSDDSKWGQIIWQEGNGWIAMRFLTPSPLPHFPNSEMPMRISCSGTEPFWTAVIWPNQMFEFTDYSGANQESQSRLIAQSTTAMGMQPYSFAFTAGEYTGLLDRAECSDGMSDRTYGWQLRIINPSLNGLQLRSGCCQAAN